MKKLKQHSFGKIFQQLICYIILVVAAFCSLFPIYYVFCKASGGNTDFTLGMPTIGSQLIPNISMILYRTDFLRCLLYTLKYVLVQTGMTLILCSMAGYGFEIYHDKGKDFVFRFVLVAMMLPFTALMVPLFLMASKFELINTVVAMIAPFIASPLIILLFRQSARAFPMELLEAARLDGLKEPFVFLRIFLPNMKSTLASAMIITFLNAWNSYQWPRIIMVNEDLVPMTVYLTLMEKGDVMTLVLLNMVPALVVFYGFQKFFVQGMQGALQ